MTKFIDVIQGTEEWFDLRKGKFTASMIKDLFMATSTKGYESAIYKVVFERLSGQRVESEFKTPYMQRGNDLETEARERYQLMTFNKVDNGGFYELNEFVGASPDGNIEQDGILEVKCPAYNTMIKYLLKKELPSEYNYQVHSQLLICEKQYCDFFAYHPSLESFVLRVERDEEICKEINKKLKESILKVKSIMKELQNGLK